MAAAQKDQKDEKDQPNNAAVGHSDTLDGSYRGHPLPATDTSADELDLAHTHPIDGPKRLECPGLNELRGMFVTRLAAQDSQEGGVRKKDRWPMGLANYEPIGNYKINMTLTEKCSDEQTQLCLWKS